MSKLAAFQAGGGARLKAKMNFPAASHGVSMKDKFNPNAASCGELNPADFAFSTSHSL